MTDPIDHRNGSGPAGILTEPATAATDEGGSDTTDTPAEPTVDAAPTPAQPTANAADLAETDRGEADLADADLAETGAADDANDSGTDDNDTGGSEAGTPHAEVGPPSGESARSPAEETAKGPLDVPEAESDPVIDGEPTPTPTPTPTPRPEDATTTAGAIIAPPDGGWSLAELRAALWPALGVVVVLAAVGYLIGWSAGPEHLVRQELVYTLDESVPDSFLREDRRLLTQLATLESDTVLGPVARDHDLDIDELRDRIAVETVGLSEVIEIEVTDDDRRRAASISAALIDRYLEVASTPVATDQTGALVASRDDVAAQLAEVDRQLAALDDWQVTDAQLATRDDSISRRLDDLGTELSALRTGIASGATDPTRPTVATRVVELETEIDTLEAELGSVRSERASLAQPTATSAALDRERSRLESELATIEAELTDRRLAPLTSSPIRPLGPPTIEELSAHRGGVRGLAIGALLGLPIAVIAAFRARRRQLWLG